MNSYKPLASPLRRAGALTAAVVAAVGLGLVPGGQAVASSDVLPLGDANLTETRVITPLTTGVTLTHIVRGTEPAPADQINTTTRGPWVVNVLTIDPKKTDGHLAATYGPNLAGVETTTDLVRSAGALAGVNASFFTFTASAQYPGDPVGLGLFDGKLLSEPGTDPAEVDLVVDATTNKVVLMGRLQWAGSIKNIRTKATLPLEFVNHPPVIPAGCAALTDQTRCTLAGDVVQFTPEFAAATPSGSGVEVVLDQRGCVVRTSTTRGTTLARDQTSLQATGQESLTLLNVANGCVKQTTSLTNEKGNKLNLRPGLFGVNGRYRLTADGQIVVPAGSPSDSFFARNPRTIAGTTRDGKIVLATIDGRMTTSVGTTMAETAVVADALGLRDAMNLDGGGSTTMSVEGELVNQPSGGSQRPVGDALVFVNTPLGDPAR